MENCSQSETFRSLAHLKNWKMAWKFEIFWSLAHLKNWKMAWKSATFRSLTHLKNWKIVHNLRPSDLWLTWKIGKLLENLRPSELKQSEWIYVQIFGSLEKLENCLNIGKSKFAEYCGYGACLADRMFGKPKCWECLS